MRHITRCSIVALTLVALPAPAAAQTDLFDIPPGPRRVDVTASGGFLLSTDWSDLTLLGSVSPLTGTVEQVLVRDLVVRPGPVFNGAVTYWEGRYGFRTHIGFAESCLTVGTSCGQIAGLGGTTSSVDVNAWMYDIGGAIGLLDYHRGTWCGRSYSWGSAASRTISMRRSAHR